jgi:putative photosynthetic complex assembly protein
MKNAIDSSNYVSFPKFPLYLVGAGLASMLLLVAAIRYTEIGTSYVSTAAPQNERALRFEDRADGSLAVVDASTAAVVEVLAPGTNGFVRGALRGLVRERKRSAIGAEVPFVLAAREDGRLTLDDPTTNRQIDLKSFGATNAAVFEKMLPARALSANQATALPLANQRARN